MSDGMGGSQTTSVQLPDFLNQATQALTQRAQQTMNIGYQPYYGPSVAAFNPMQQAAFQGANDAASAFGLPSVQGNAGGGLDGMMGQPKNFGGVLGYSSAPGFNRARHEWAQRNPGQAQAYSPLFVNPKTGKGGL